MIALARISPYRPCDWPCGRRAEFELSVEYPLGVRRFYCCRGHLGVAALRAAEAADGEPLAMPFEAEGGRE